LVACALVFVAAVAWTACGDGDGNGNGTGTGPEPTGSIEVSLVMSGESLDPDGCVFTVDGAGERRMLGGESATYAGLAVGQHQVSISDVAGNCQVQGESIRSVSVVADQTATVTFSVACASDVGGIRVSTTTAGEELDPDGYDVVVDGGAPLAITVDGTVTVGGLAPGDHSVALEGVAANCSVAGGDSRSVTVSAGQTTDVSFSVTCSATSGSLVVTTSTTGEDLDEDGYEIVIDGGAPSGIAIDGSVSAGGLSPGSHTVELRSAAFNCFVSGDNPRTVTVNAGAETQVDFDVACRYHLWNRIAFVTDRGAGGIWAVDPYDGSAPRSLDLSGSTPAVSPDGLRLAYQRGGDIWVANSDGSDPQQLTDNNQSEADPAWSPDGSRIAYEREVPGQDEVWVMNADGSNQASLGIEGYEPTWSPDGSKIAFTRSTGGEDIFVANPASDHDAAWSPLGNFISFTSDRDGPDHIFVIDPLGGPATNMTIVFGLEARHSSWAPAAVAGAFMGYDGVNYDIYYFDPAIPQLFRLTTHQALDGWPSWGGGN
jgi:hypothetical protein